MGSSSTNCVRHKRARMQSWVAPSSYVGTKTVNGEGGTCGLARLWLLSENSTKDVPEWPRDRRLRDWNTAAAYRRRAACLLLPS